MIKAKEHVFSGRSGSLDTVITGLTKPTMESKSIMNGDIRKDTHPRISPIVQARLDSNGDVNGVNRFKYHITPVSARPSLPHRSTLLSAPLSVKTTTPVLEEWTEKKPLELRVRSGSSGYQSTRSSSRVQAISDRLYGGTGNRNRSLTISCSRGSGSRSGCGSIDHPVPKSITNGSLPDIDTKDIRLVMSANSDRVSISRKSDRSPVSTSGKRILINLERNDNGMKDISEKLAWRGNKLRQEIEEKLKHVQLRHERAMRILRDQHRQDMPLSIDRPQITPIPHPPIGNPRFVRRSRYSINPMTEKVPAMLDKQISTISKQQSVSKEQSELPEPQPDQDASSLTSPSWPDRSIADINLVDSPLVDNDIIKPLVDAVLRDSIESLSAFRANEMLALGIAQSDTVYFDVEQFLYNQVIPGAVQVAHFATKS